jgi:hypothetical protein
MIPHERRARADSGTPKRQVMGDHDSALSGRTIEPIGVGPANQLLVPRCPQIAASRLETGDDVRSDVLVCQEREVERRHAVILSSHVRSPFSASAAYRKAAARPSAVSWGY